MEYIADCAVEHIADCAVEHIADCADCAVEHIVILVVREDPVVNVHAVVVVVVVVPAVEIVVVVVVVVVVLAVHSVVHSIADLPVGLIEQHNYLLPAVDEQESHTWKWH